MSGYTRNGDERRRSVDSREKQRKGNVTPADIYSIVRSFTSESSARVGRIEVRVAAVIDVSPSLSIKTQLWKLKDGH